MTTPVRHLKISDPLLPDPVTVDLPWDQFPAASQQELDALDTDHDGTLTYVPAFGGPPAGSSTEVQHANGTGDRLNRILWGLEWVSPNNNRSLDRATLPDRMRQIQTLQNTVYDKVVLPLLGDRMDPAKWREAQRILSEDGDYAHLYRLAQIARARYDSSKDIEFLRIAESMLLAAKRYASRVRDGRLNYYKGIEAELGQINPALDKADRSDFQTDTQSPYLLAAPGSPITADLSTLQKEDGMVWFGVAVPQSFVTANQKDLNTAIANYFNNDSSVALRSSAFKDATGSQEFRMTAVRVEKDNPGSADDPIDAQSSYHLDQARLNRTVFAGQTMTYFRVGFRMDKPSEALDAKTLRKFDIALKHGQRTRTVPGGFVLQNRANQTSRDVFASDVHVSERDQEIVRIMADSLRSLAARYETDGIQPDQVSTLRNQAEEVERFYESVNEQPEAALEQWNESYRNGEIDRVFLAGDLADFVNIAATLERQGYRSTNIRRLREILGRIEAPLYVVSGNHDHHGYPFPLSLHLRNFIYNEGLRDLYGPHYDDHRFPKDNIRYFDGVKGLLPISSSGDGWVSDVLSELSADDPFGPRNDDFLGHEMREIGIYETYGVGLGNGFRVFAWPTETEHFNYARYLLEEVHDPVNPAILNGIAEYVGKQHVNGKGPRPETFIAFLREMEAAQKNGQRLILMGHYPTFFAGEGPEQTPDAVDTLRGDAAWAVRLAAWYYRRSNGESVMPLSIAGHVHQYAESDFTLHFQDTAQEEKFRKELGGILAKKNASNIFDELHHLRHSWDLDNRIAIRRIQEAGSDGFPGPIMKDLNNDSHAYCKKQGTAFLTLPTVGIPTEEDSGYVVVTTQPDGRIAVAPKFIRVGPRANIVTADGPQLEAYRKARWNEVRDWDPSRTIPAFQAHSSPTAITTTGPGTPGKQTHWGLLPLVYQYPLNKLSLGATASVGTNLRYGGFDWMVGGTFFVPTSHTINTVWGGPNYPIFEANYWNQTKDLGLKIGANTGLLDLSARVDRVTRGDPFLGGEIYFHGPFPHLGLVMSAMSTVHGEWIGFFGLRLDQSVITYRMPQHFNF